MIAEKFQGSRHPVQDQMVYEGRKAKRRIDAKGYKMRTRFLEGRLSVCVQERLRCDPGWGRLSECRTVEPHIYHLVYTSIISE